MSLKTRLKTIGRIVNSLETQFGQGAIPLLDTTRNRPLSPQVCPHSTPLSVSEAGLEAASPNSLDLPAQAKPLWPFTPYVLVRNREVWPPFSTWNTLWT